MNTPLRRLRDYFACGAAILIFSAAPLLAAEAPESALTPCLACSGDYQPIAPNAAVPTTCRQLFVVFQLGPSEHFKKLVSTWIADDVGDAAPAGYKMSKGELRLEHGATSGQIRYFQPKDLPVGTYHVDVVADGKPWKSATFTVVDAPAHEIRSPQSLVRLVEGMTWNYDFVQEVGPGANFAESDFKPDADGKLRAKVTATVEKKEADGMHVVFARNGTPVSEEWWTLNDQGLVASRRIVDGTPVALDPPQVLLARPTSGFMNWKYNAADGSFTQDYREYCLNVNAGPGIPAGMLVVTEQDLGGGAKVVVERHWVIGRGMVREIITTTLASHMISRQSMVLH